MPSPVAIDPMSTGTPSESMRMRTWLRMAGLVVSVAAVGWIAWRFMHGGVLLTLERAPIGGLQLAGVLALGVLAYALAPGILAFAWWRLLATLSPRVPPAGSTMATWAVSQYGKYLPGNVAHFALRHAWSRRQSIPHTTLALAAMLEAALLLLAALAFAVLGAPDARDGLLALDPRLVICAVVAALGFLWLASRWFSRRGHRGRVQVPVVPARLLVSVLACHGAFFAIGGLVLFGLSAMLGAHAATLPMMLTVGAASWAAGFVVIGAPAGLGVREAVFVALCGTAIGENNALLLIALYRIVTFGADTLLFAVGALVMRHVRPAQT